MDLRRKTNHGHHCVLTLFLFHVASELLVRRIGFIEFGHYARVHHLWDSSL